MEVIQFIDDLDIETKSICLEIYDLFMNLPGFESKIRYKVPFFSRKTWLAYINPLKNGGIELCFLHGFALTDPFNILESKGRKQVSGITLLKYSDIDRQKIMVLINAAISHEENLKP